jgi:hypothetical protein
MPPMLLQQYGQFVNETGATRHALVQLGMNWRRYLIVEELWRNLDELSNEIEDDGLDDDEGEEERTDPLDEELDELDEDGGDTNNESDESDEEEIYDTDDEDFVPSDQEAEEEEKGLKVPAGLRRASYLDPPKFIPLYVGYSVHPIKRFKRHRNCKCSFMY